MTESTYWDHSQSFVWEWFIQMIRNKNVYFFYDFKKRSFVRKVTHVKGKYIIDYQTGDVLFEPFEHKIIKYSQWR
jgi:hypothetical protein